MNAKNSTTTHWSFWLVSVIALIWNVLGIVNFFVQMDPAVIAHYRETERVIVAGRPVWATAGFAVAVFGGAFGSLFLLLKNQVSYYLFVASLVGVMVTMIHSLGIGVDFSAGEILGIILMPMLVALFLIWYVKFAEHKGWIS